MNTNNNTIFSKLPGYTPLQHFTTIVDQKLWGYYSGGHVFSVLVIEFTLKDSSYASKTNNFVQHIGTTIHKNLKQNEDFYTVDENGRFISFFSEDGVNLAILTISKIVHEIKQELKDYISLDIGIAECPQDGATCKDLVESAISAIHKTKEKAQKTSAAPNLLAKSILEKAREASAKGGNKLVHQLTALVNHIAGFDTYLGEHSCLVAAGSIILAKELDLPWHDIEKISVAALLHDIGYTIYPKNLFQNPGKLSNDEWKLVKLHPIIASEQILRPLSIFDDYLPIIQSHHEYIDGSGYPRRKKGEQIPIGAQIISIIDSYQAMRADRPYRKAINFEDIVDVYIRNAGIKWDKELITCFTALIGDPKMRENLANSKSLGMGLPI